MKRRLTFEEVKGIERDRYQADYRRLMQEPPTHRGPHGYGPSLFEQHERQPKVR